jgi:hypothetical protein
MFNSTCSQRMTATSTPYGSAGHEPVPTSRQAIGDPAVPSVTQHLYPLTQSLSSPQGAPVPPLPGMHEVVLIVSTPFSCAAQAVE